MIKKSQDYYRRLDLEQEPKSKSRQPNLARSGELVIDKEKDLGLNDPLTHLYEYIQEGDEALIAIKQDIETDIAERLPKTPFINYVGFELKNNDFLSIKDQVSMKKMLQTNLNILSKELKDNPHLQQEYDRAVIEAEEADKLTTWFKTAPNNAFLVFESLPIGDQEIAISRIYRKANDQYLDGCFVSLYNPSVVQFNELRGKLIPGHPAFCKDELAILKNNYAFYNPRLSTAEDFIDFYVETYDQTIQERYNKPTSFGLDKKVDIDQQNGIDKVRKHSQLTDIYLEAIKSLAEGEGLATEKLITIGQRLHLDLPVQLNDRLTTDQARSLLQKVIVGIAGVIDKSDQQLLDQLSNLEPDSDALYDSIATYSEIAQQSAENYANVSCPTINRTESQTSSQDDDLNDFRIMARAFGIHEDIKDFGKPRLGVCTIKGCPSHGTGLLTNETLVGGCGICVRCHKLLQKGKNPTTVYEIEAKEQEHQQRLKEMETTRLKLKKRNEQERQARRQAKTKKAKPEKAH